MGEVTQKNRLLGITIPPHDEDFLLLRRVSATEGLSQLFSIEVELLHEESKVDYNATPVKDSDIIGKAATIRVNQVDGSARYMSGIINRFSQGSRNFKYSVYSATIVPRVWVLTQSRQSRIFQQMKVEDILRKVFEKFEVIYEIQGDFKPRNYCVQYRESDFDFASRLMEEEGIYYYFEHVDGMDKMIIGNTPQSHRDCPNKSEIPIFMEKDESKPFQSSFRDWRIDHKLQAGKIINWDYNFQKPAETLSQEAVSQMDAGGNKSIIVYDWPGGYARKYDGINKGGGEQDGDLNDIYSDGRNSVKNQIDALDAQYSPITAISDCSSLTAGHRFKLTEHPNSESNKQYVVLTTSCEYEQAPDYPDTEESIGKCETTITCMPQGAGTPSFRPPRVTEKPVIFGAQTATVVGPGGEEIFTDKYGRVKVQFHWDRSQKYDSDASCWARVAQSWAGNNWGTMFIPRIGMEVVVHFLEGDPDLPIITGCVYNPSTMPPYTLPDEKTKSTIRSNSSIGGNGFNEFRFEDKKGEEQIFIHGEKDLDIRIKNDAKQIVKNDHHTIIENNSYSSVKGDTHIAVTGDENKEVKSNASLNVSGGDYQVKTSGKFATDAGSEIHLKAGMKVVIEAGTQITMKVGGNFVDIGPAGVSIKGTMVLINSGGAPGSGSGSSPTAPTDPQEADDAESGSPMADPPPPPEEPDSYSPPAAAMMDASDNGSPLCSGGGTDGDYWDGQSDSGSGSSTPGDNSADQPYDSGTGSGAGGETGGGNTAPYDSGTGSGTGGGAGGDNSSDQPYDSGTGSGAGGEAGGGNQAPYDSGTGSGSGGGSGSGDKGGSGGDPSNPFETGWKGDSGSGGGGSSGSGDKGGSGGDPSNPFETGWKGDSGSGGGGSGSGSGGKGGGPGGFDPGGGGSGSGSGGKGGGSGESGGKGGGPGGFGSGGGSGGGGKGGNIW